MGIAFSSSSFASLASTVTTTPSGSAAGASSSTVISVKGASGSDCAASLSGTSSGAGSAATASRTAGRSSSTSPLRPITTRPSGRERSTSMNSPSSAGGGVCSAAVSPATGFPSGVSSRKGFSSSSGTDFRAATGSDGRSTRIGAGFCAAGSAAFDGAGCGAAAFGPGFGAGSGTSSAAPSSPAARPCSTTLCLRISTTFPLLSTTTLPASLTLLMKLRLMKTPVSIQPPTSRISVPKAPICVRSRAEEAMPKAPPHPVEQQRLQRSAKANPSVSDPRIIIRNSERIEWLNSSGR